MQIAKPLFLLAGLAVGGAAGFVLRPATPAAASAAPPSGLLDGRYVVFQNDYGNWIYERQEGGAFKPVVKELSPRGLESIWGLQADFKPMTLATSKGEVLYVPFTQYSTETGAFNTTHKFFRMTDAGLTEVPLGAPEK